MLSLCLLCFLCSFPFIPDLLQIFDLDRLDLIGGGKPEDAGVKVQLGFNRSPDVGCFSEAVAFGRKSQISEWEALGLERCNHGFGLGRRHNLIF